MNSKSINNSYNIIYPSVSIFRMWLEVLVLFATSLTSISGGFVPRGTMSPRRDFHLVGSASPNHHHQLVFQVKQNGLKQLEDLVLELSSPESPKYQQWLTFEEVGLMTARPDDCQAIVDWLSSSGIQVYMSSELHTVNTNLMHLMPMYILRSIQSPLTKNS